MAVVRYWVSPDEHTTPQAAAQRLWAAVASITDCQFAYGGGAMSYADQSSGYGANYNYPSVEWSLVYTFAVAGGGSWRTRVPAPGDWVMKADGITPNFDEPATASVVTAVLDWCCMPDGRLFTGLVSCRLVFHRWKRLAALDRL
jgi:hypothetical protein